MPEPLYDGFISYSHAADDLLAPRLQAGLQRFAKPWWKRRAIRVFRDESSLSANPHLWTSITEALDSSEWFVLLLSEEAAASEWVEREIEHWIARREPSQIIPVVTSGEFGWSADDVAGSAVPPALQGVFSEEPRWVDLRFAKGDELLDLKNPAFAAAVADIASALRGVPKDELASEEVKQHRRTIRTAWVAGTLVAVLGAAATVFGLQADEQRALAEANAEIAAENEAQAAANAAEALQQRDLALQNEAEAEANAEFAVRQARLDEADRILAIANLAEAGDPTRTVSLALYAAAVAGENVSEIEASVAGFLHARLPLYRAERWWTLGEPERAVIAPGGGTIYYMVTDQTSSVTDVASFHIDDGEVVWSQPTAGDKAGELAVSPDGSQLVASTSDLRGGSLTVYNSDTGQVLVERDLGECPIVNSWGPGFSPDGRYFTQFSGSADCHRSGAESWVIVYETTGWTEIGRLHSSPASSLGSDGSADTAHFSSDGTVVLISGMGAITELRSFPDLELIRAFGSNHLAVALSPDGTQVALQPSEGRPLLVESSTGATLVELDIGTGRALSEDDPISFSPDGDRLMIQTGSHDFVFAVGSRELVYSFEHGYSHQHSWTNDGAYLFESTGSGLLLWRVGDLLDQTPLPLDFSELISVAAGRLGRGFTEVECPTFLLEPCLNDPNELRDFVMEQLAIDG